MIISREIYIPGINRLFMIGNGNATILAAKTIIPKIPVLILHRSIPYHTEGSATFTLYICRETTDSHSFFFCVYNSLLCATHILILILIHDVDSKKSRENCLHNFVLLSLSIFSMGFETTTTI